MGIQPHDTYPIPEDTRRVACAAFPKGNMYTAISLKFSGLFEIRACFPGKSEGLFTESCVAGTSSFGLKLRHRAERASESAYFAAFRGLVPNL